MELGSELLQWHTFLSLSVCVNMFCWHQALRFPVWIVIMTYALSVCAVFMHRDFNLIMPKFVMEALVWAQTPVLVLVWKSFHDQMAAAVHLFAAELLLMPRLLLSLISLSKGRLHDLLPWNCQVLSGGTNLSPRPKSCCGSKCLYEIFLEYDFPAFHLFNSIAMLSNVCMHWIVKIFCNVSRVVNFNLCASLIVNVTVVCVLCRFLMRAVVLWLVLRAHLVPSHAIMLKWRIWLILFLSVLSKNHCRYGNNFLKYFFITRLL